MPLWIIARPGPYIMADTINEGIPPRVLAQHTGIAFLTQHGERHNIVSYRHPAFLARVVEWYTAGFAVLKPRQVTRGGRILMIKLDYEMGMLPWVRNHLDLNPDTLAHFARHVRETPREGVTSRYPGRSLAGTLTSALRNPKHARGRLDPAATPTLWVMVDERCPAEVQTKLVAHVRAGGRLVLVGRMPQVDLDHQPCRILADALGITAIETQPPFRREDVRLFEDPAAPVAGQQVKVVGTAGVVSLTRRT
jgi:hypothetical protein